MKTFWQTNHEIASTVPDIEFSGTTCAMILVNGQQLHTANTGDSRAILCTLERGEIQGNAITRDHKPDEPDEAARILAHGGRIEPFKGTRRLLSVDPNGEHVGPLRVWQKEQDIPGLAMTRALGDAAAVVAGVIPDPGPYSWSSL